MKKWLWLIVACLPLLLTGCEDGSESFNKVLGNVSYEDSTLSSLDKETNGTSTISNTVYYATIVDKNGHSHRLAVSSYLYSNLVSFKKTTDSMNTKPKLDVVSDGSSIVAVAIAN